MATMVEDSPVVPVQAPVEPEPLPTFDEPEPEAAVRGTSAGTGI
jgi:hypothetical protein